MLSRFCFIDFTFFMLFSGLINKNFTLETTGLPFALLYHLAQLNSVSQSFLITPPSEPCWQRDHCHDWKEVSYELLQQLLQVLHIYFKVCQAWLAEVKKPLICRYIYWESGWCGYLNKFSKLWEVYIYVTSRIN